MASKKPGLIARRTAAQPSALGPRNLNNASFGLPTLPPVSPYKELGGSGTAVWGGFVQVKDTNSKWIGQQKWRTISELMVNTSVVAAGVHYFLNLIAGPKWTAQPADDSEEAKDLAKFVDDVLADLEQPWASVVRQAGMYRFHGFSVQEWTAKKRDDGKIGFVDVEVRPQHTIEQWAIDNNGSVIGMYQRPPQTSTLLGLPRGKVMYLVEDTLTDSPDGLGVFRHLADPYNRLKRYIELEARAFERDLRGIPVGRAPLAAINQAVKANEMTEDQAKALISGITSLISTQVKQSDTGILLDSQPYLSTTAGGPTISPIYQWGFDLLNGTGLGLAEISNAIERIQREMARVIGVEHLMLGDVGGGRAVSQDKSRNVYLIASSVLRMIVAAAQKDLINPLWVLNNLPQDKKPKLMAEDIAPRDVIELTTALARMSQSGAVLAPDDPVVNDVRDLLGVSRAKPIEVQPEILSDDPNAINPDDSNPNGETDPDDPNGDKGGGNANIKDNMQRFPRQTMANKDPVS